MHQVVTLLNLLQQLGDVGRIVLQVAVQRDRYVSRGIFQPRLHGSGLSEKLQRKRITFT